MNVRKAKDNGFTHIGKIYGVKCYCQFIDDGGCEVEGTNYIRRKLIDFLTWVDVELVQLSDGFYIQDVKEI